MSAAETQGAQASTKLRNIGPVSAAWLAQVGVHSRADLEAAGVVATYRRVRAVWPGVTVNMLYALQGALLDVGWSALSPDVRESLRKEAGE